MVLKEKIFYTKLYLMRMDSNNPIYPLPDGFSLHKLTYQDVDIVSSAHRDSKTTTARLDEGQVAFWVKHKEKCVNIQWYSTKAYFVWDIRSVVCFPEGSCYLFDGFTDPGLRGQGINKGALSGLIEKAHLLSSGSIYSLVQHKNSMGWGFLQKFGFYKADEISLLQIPPFRFYCISRERKEIQLRVMSFHNRPLNINLDKLKLV